MALQELIARLQQEGAKWVINTGRDLPSLIDGLQRARLAVTPDFVVTVEREIHVQHRARYHELDGWNRACADVHDALFARVRPDLPELCDWVQRRFAARVYEDAYSPLCLIAGDNDEMDAIQAFLETYCAGIPELTVVRNDIYARFSHVAFNKGTALAEIARTLGVGTLETLAAGDHFNDLPMLTTSIARWLVAPSNAIPEVKLAVERQAGFVGDRPWGHGVLEGLRACLRGGA
jgi:hypothetical protein